MARRQYLKSETEMDQFELDQEAIDAVNEQEGFGEDVSESDVKEAVAAIAAIAEEVLEDEEKLEPEEVVEKVSEIVEGEDFVPEVEEEEVEEVEGEEMPEELNNALVRIMVQEGDEVELDGSTVEDEIRQETVEGETATVFDTVGDSGEVVDEMDFAEEAEDEDLGLVVLGNSLVKNPSYKKGFVTLKSSVRKEAGKCWSAAYKKVRAMIGSRKMNATDWAIVSCLALSMAKKQKIASSVKANNMKRVMSAAKNNVEFKKALMEALASGCHGKKEEKKEEKKEVESATEIKSARLSKFDKVPKEVWDKILDDSIEYLKGGIEIDPGETSAEAVLLLLKGKAEDVEGADGEAAYDLLDDWDTSFSTIKRYFASRFPEKWNKIYNAILEENKRLRAWDREDYRLHNSRKVIKSELTDEIEQSTETKQADEPEETVATDFGKVDENPDFAEGEVVEPYGDVPDVPADGTPVEDPEDLIQPGAEDVVEVSVPVESSKKNLVLKKIMNGVYKVSGTRVTSKFVSKRCPLKSGTVICLKNGKALLLKNSNTAGMLAFMGKLVKSSKKAPYFAVRGEDGVFITQNKKGSDLFAIAEKKCLFNSILNARKSAKVASSKVVEDRKARLQAALAKKEAVVSARKSEKKKPEAIKNNRLASLKQSIQSKIELKKKDREIEMLKSQLEKAKVDAIQSKRDSDKLKEMTVAKERDRLFQSNKSQLDNIAKIDQINSSKNVDTMASMLDRMF